MQSILRSVRRLWRPPLQPRRFPRSNFERIDSSCIVEEEAFSWYPQDFYPVQIGEVFQSKYQVTGKLGYGSSGTVWLCRDLIDHTHVTLKVGAHSSLKNEVAVLKHLKSINSSHAGARMVRELLDDFEISDGTRQYQCLIQAPMSATLESLQLIFPGQAIPINLLKITLTRLLLALDFLHGEAKVIHTDIQAKNILLRMDGFWFADDVCGAFEKQELENPSPRKFVDGRVIHTSRPLVPLIYEYGAPVLSDFGEACFGDYNPMVLIQPSVYRAPEVLLGIPFTPMVDIWNVGVMIFNLLGKGHLFERTGGPEQEEADVYHLAHMVALLGPPPADFISRTENGRSWEFFHEDGTWKGVEDLPKTTLDDALQGWDPADQAGLTTFMRKILQWRPEDRSSPKQLLQDPWLKSK